MQLPPELHRLIICHATYVPGALDTSYDTILHEDGEAILECIADSMDVKRSLCLVSKLFYDLTEEYLYEIIMFRRVDHIPRVANSLSTLRNGISPGIWCRRLDIYLGRLGCDYQGEDWNGSAILWGLIPACPNVTVFSFHGSYSTESIRQMTHGHDFPLVPSVALWKIMATSWASSLRRIDMSGIWMRADRFELFIRYFQHLQACRITTIEPFFPQMQVFDKDEKSSFLLARGHKSRIPTSIRFMSPDALAMLHRYQSTAAWPAYNRDIPYSLPSLHTLHLDYFPRLLSHFNLPNVRFLGAYDLLGLGVRAGSLYSEFRGMSSTFSSSLTRFTWGSDFSVDFGKLFGMLPYLTHLKILMPREFNPFLMRAPRHPQPTVTHIELVQMSTNFEAISSILSFIQSGLFPNLESILILCRDAQLQAIKDDFQLTGEAGVSVQISGGAQSILKVLPRSPLYP